MPCIIRLLTPDDLLDAGIQADSLADAAALEPHDGVYTVGNTFHRTQVLLIDAHFDRLEDSARRAGIPLSLNRPRLRAALRQMIEQSAFGDVRYRVSVSRDRPDEFRLSIEPFHPLPASVFDHGVAVITVTEGARATPEAKTTGWMHDRQTLEASLPSGAFTAILTGPRGELLEGLSSNFYVIRDGILFTAGSDVLPGMARRIVLMVAADMLPVRLEAPLLTDLPQFDEAFLTSASRGIVPIVRIDEVTLGDGMPGRMTRALRARYLDWAAAHLEEL